MDKGYRSTLKIDSYSLPSLPVDSLAVAGIEVDTGYGVGGLLSVISLTKDFQIMSDLFIY